ncbi:MAG: transglutaminase-like domain-containing protein [Desulfuromonadaceae bacterium]|nr:transglutaminase-like domain-containing protein [Desulfuromonadaceae bacterium]MDD2855277.1 transglutaminase-like domain-containing protein [Desulfuromonadaceae bacterium]
MRALFNCFTVFIFLFCTALNVSALPFKKIDKLPLSERWFGIYVNSERVGFYRQQIEKIESGYRIEGNGTVRMKVMSFAKESSMRETYLVSNQLALDSFDVEQTINGERSHIRGEVKDNTVKIKKEADGRTTEKILKFKGELFPNTTLNFYPLMRPVSPGSVYNIKTFDAEEQRIKDVQITLLGEDKTSEGVPALKLRNNLYPFVNNDIWVDAEGNTLEESVREGLVTTKSEQPESLGTYITDWALAKKDLIYDFSLVRAEPPIKNPKELRGLIAEISEWNTALPLLQGVGQQLETLGGGRVLFKTGTFADNSLESRLEKPTAADTKSAENIESDAAEIIAQAKLLGADVKTGKPFVKILVSWTADHLKDSVDDGGGALKSLKSGSGNCQTHARLYTALARASGIPTKFVSGLVYLNGKGFLYHSWAESFVDDQWVSVDPTYNQFPVDPTHIKLLEGHLPEDMLPIVAIIGRIKMKIIETSY